MDAPIDVATTAAVRRVLVRHWIDLGQLSVRVTRGMVFLAGQLITLPEAPEQLDPLIVADLFAEMQHIPSIKRLQIELSNWAEVDERWQSIPTPESPASLGDASTTAS